MSLPESATFIEYARSRLQEAVFNPDFAREDEQVFAASLASTCGLIDLLSADAGTAARSVVCGFLDTMTPNAFADRVGDRHYIGMHQALLVTIVDLALFAFTQADFMPEIGDVAIEESPLPVFGAVPGLFLLDRTLAGGVIDPNADRHRVPNDETRHASAIYFALLMARFVWLHEWAHCALGHVTRLQAHDLKARLVEVPTLVAMQREQKAGSLSRDDRHAMEFEADALALRSCLAIEGEGLENVPGIAAFSRHTRIELILTGAFLMAWLFDAYGRHLGVHSSYSHPTPANRLAALRTVAPSELTSVGFKADDRFHVADAMARSLITRLSTVSTPIE